MGLRVKKEFLLGLDSWGDVGFFSHAHADHVNGLKRCKELVMSRETAYFLEITKYKTSFNGLKLFSAGHMLGSLQALVDMDGYSLIYTGDFNAKDNILVKGGQFLEGDVLVIDGTYAYPYLKFPSPFDVYLEMERWIRNHREKPIVFKTYNIGKPQEIVKFLNQYLDIVPYVSPRILISSQKHRMLGIKLDFLPYDRPLKKGDIAVVGKRDLIYSKESPLIVETTGWALLRNVKAHKVFPLSNHSDFFDIVEYIKYSGAKKVFLLNAKKGVGKIIKRLVR